MLVQNIWGIEIKSVEAFRISVNTITETESEPITASARFDNFFSPSSDAPITIGNNGRIHGASTVSIPASNAIRKKIILLYL